MMRAVLVLAMLVSPSFAAFHLRRKEKQPLTEAELRATGDTGYPCVASGDMIHVCNWYFDFVKEHKEPPKSLKEPYIHGGTHEWHGPDPELSKACEANYNTICVQRNPLCDEHFDLC